MAIRAMPYPLDSNCFVPLAQDRIRCREQLTNMAGRVFLSEPPSLEVIIKRSDNGTYSLRLELIVRSC
jgi:hypothetical protein